MKTHEELISEGYAEDWACECPFCHSWNCHEYLNIMVCFSCKRRERLSLVKRLRNKPKKTRRSLK